ncbi:MAG: DUF3102 domain-containing protein [Intestinimonas sp.]|jgi:hypothetical protein|nr:DUF3102 domain-containing protein [Intestinimonas sp.]
MNNMESSERREPEDTCKFRCGSCVIGHWYSNEYDYVSVVTPGGGTEKRPCEPHTHYCSHFAEGQRKIADDENFDPDTAPDWCPLREEAQYRKNTEPMEPLVSLKQQHRPPAQDRTIQAVTLEIKTLHQQFKQIVLGYAIEIGRRLVEAKSMLGHGEWGDWLRNEVEFSQSTANNLMRIFEEYGADQMGLFGPEANSQTLGNLPYTKALKLLAIPVEEREAFAEEHDVEHLSTRELDKLIHERDEALSAQKAAEEKLNSMTADLSEAQENLDNMVDEVSDANRERDEALQAKQSAEKAIKDQLDEQQKVYDVDMEAERAKLKVLTEKADDLEAKLAAAKKKAKQEKDAVETARRELEDLKKKPVEVAVQQPSDEAMAKLKADAEAEAAEKIAEKERELQKAAERLKAAEEKAAAAEKQLAMSDEATTTFKLLFTQWQKSYLTMMEALNKVERSDEIKAQKLKNAVRAAAGNMGAA